MNDITDEYTPEDKELFKQFAAQKCDQAIAEFDAAHAAMLSLHAAISEHMGDNHDAVFLDNVEAVANETLALIHAWSNDPEFCEAHLVSLIGTSLDDAYICRVVQLDQDEEAVDPVTAAATGIASLPTADQHFLLVIHIHASWEDAEECLHRQYVGGAFEDVTPEDIINGEKTKHD